MNEQIDFLFVYDELKDKYSSIMGRNAEDVIRMFKFLILKSKDKMSDRGLIKRTLTDLEYMETEEFGEMYKERNKIEAKNSELQNNTDMTRRMHVENLESPSKGQLRSFLPISSEFLP